MCDTQRLATVEGHYMYLTLRASIPHEKHWLPPSFPALLLNSPPPSQVLASGSLFTRERSTNVLSFHTPGLILRSESSRYKLNLFQAVPSWRLRRRVSLISSA